MSYITHMEDQARSRFDSLFEGVRELVLVDFPDHANVGDSAIALGELRYFERSGIDVRAIHCIGTYNDSILSSRVPVVINGGGNIAGFFAQIDEHRLRIGRDLRPSTMLVQAPQSIHFVSEEARAAFLSGFASRPNLRMAVRDAEGSRALEEHATSRFLVPDAVHLLGPIEAPAPTRRIVVLARRDRESQAADAEEESVDWPKDSDRMRRATWRRWKIRFLGRLGGMLNPSPSVWRGVAEQRLARGVAVLAPAETVITDRLHGMLIALQMGRSVVAIDNSNSKSSKYADTWFGSSQPSVTFAASFSEALRITRSS